jgi:hypothetical protein
MKTMVLAGFGWLVPGGAHLLMRRYVPCALFAAAVWIAFAAGLALQGGGRWPSGAELAGLDGPTALLFRAGAVAQALAGAPFLLAQWLGLAGTFLDGRLHEYGTTLLAMAGTINLLAVSSALDRRKDRAR